jgi:GNAT superfamily N-acetyltransferase
MIRPATPEDTPALLAMTTATGVFKPMEVDTLDVVLTDYHAQARDAGDRCFVLEQDGGPIAFEYHAAEPMTEGTWCLWWIVVRPDIQGKGHGARLLEFVEDDARSRGARVLFVETSGLPHYEPTRRFYLRHGYAAEARLRDFYADGDDQVVFRKRL